MFRDDDVYKYCRTKINAHLLSEMYNFIFAHIGNAQTYSFKVEKHKSTTCIIHDI